jgi:prolyl-tRNA synthetase
MAGVYSFLPLGSRVLSKVENLVREEMDQLGSQEVLMPALQPRDNWSTTGRWDTVDVLFKFKGAGDRDMTLGPTHEEIVTPLVGHFIQSHRDLPTSVYQIQGKFRDEARAKSGLLRGREFRMKDMYSFHASTEDLDAYYERVTGAYRRIFERCGLGPRTFMTYASGGSFCRFSHEFQTLTPHGEDTVYVCREKNIAINKEIYAELRNDPEWRNLEFVEEKAIEVGNIFKLGTRFSDAFSLSFTDPSSGKAPIHMGCYGVGTTRILGTVVEALHDKDGIIWPKEIAPFHIHLVSLLHGGADQTPAEELFKFLERVGVEVLFDDRSLSTGQKLKDADLMGLPYRVVLSQRSLASQSVEIKERDSGKVTMMNLNDFREAVVRESFYS